MGKLKYKVKA